MTQHKWKEPLAHHLVLILYFIVLYILNLTKFGDLFSQIKHVQDLGKAASSAFREKQNGYIEKTQFITNKYVHHSKSMLELD